ncbi:AtzG-like protein [Bordetella sp. N]|uniref:AtzG-like protein n=1 Tax=Bordetella sp. N TaxID=1746199 RepID=UPI00070E0B54|nr:AtzG-like protein [Bordetella sp. N]ALM86054.1 hypothetical protein ASB57_26640 [Bordetella sp. N]
MGKQVIAEDAATLDQLLSTTIAVFGLTVEPEWREEVRYFAGAIVASAKLLQTADLGDRAEPATVYLP